MSIKPRGQGYQIDVKVGPVRVRKIFRCNRIEARQHEARIRQELIENQVPVHGLEEALLKYLKEYSIHLKSEKGVKNKAARLLPYIKNKGFDDIPSITRQLKKLDLKPATINRQLSLLKRICSLAFKEWGWIKLPVAQKISLLPENNKRHIYLTEKQVEKLAGYCQHKGSSDAIRAAAFTGMRKAELLGIKKKVGNTVVVEKSKTGSTRTIPIHPKIKDIKWPIQVSETTLRRDWVQARKKAKLEHVHFHDLRHTCASWLAQAGVNLHVIGEILGHSEAQTTKRYAHLGREDLRAAIEKMGHKKGHKTYK